MEYYLHGIIIIEHSENDYNWAYDTEFHIEDKIQRVCLMSPKCWIENDVLLMGSWKSQTSPIKENEEDYTKYLKSLPKWDKTKYYIKMGDVGNTGLMDCQTGKGVKISKQEEEKIMISLGFKRKI